MLKIKHILHPKYDNYRSLSIFGTDRNDNDHAPAVIDKISHIKYECDPDKTSIQDQFYHVLEEFQHTNIVATIRHSISPELKATLLPIFPVSPWCFVKINQDRNNKDFKVVMRGLMPSDNPDVIEELKLDSVGGFTVDIIETETGLTETTISFKELNKYKILKLIGTISVIEENFVSYSIIIPMYYMEYLNYVTDVEINHI